MQQRWSEQRLQKRKSFSSAEHLNGKLKYLRIKVELDTIVLSYDDDRRPHRNPIDRF